MITEPTKLNVINADQWINKHYFSAVRGTSDMLPLGIFQQFPELIEIDISLGLQTIEKEDLIGAERLLKLNFDENQIEILPTDVFRFAKNLEQIVISKNQLHVIEDFAFKGLNNIKNIDLHQNSLTILKRNTFTGAENLQKINLDDNEIETIEENALDLPKLRQLTMERNRIRSLSDYVFIGIPNIEQIHLTSNKISHIGNSFYGLANLQILMLSHNRINDIVLSQFAELPRFIYLALRNSGYRIDEFDRNRSVNSRSPLIYLDIAENNLSDPNILNHLEMFVNLAVLDLNDNYFSEVNGIDDVKKKYLNLSKIYLTNNQFSCRKLRSIVQILRFQDIYVPTSGKSNCSD